jgi:hypothetical protein
MSKVPLLSSQEVYVLLELLRRTNFLTLGVPEEDKVLLIDLRRRMREYLLKSHHPSGKAHRKREKEIAAKHAKKEAEKAERQRRREEHKANMAAFHANMAAFRALRKQQREARRLARNKKV